MSRKLKAVPTDAVAGFCLATALLAALVHVMVETTVWPETPAQWLAIIALGIGPVGAAFFTWDIGMKRGDIRVLGAASYATPLLSTAFLILAGFAKPTASIAIAAILIAGGGLIAAKDMVWRDSDSRQRCAIRHMPAALGRSCALAPRSDQLRGSQSFGASSKFANSKSGRDGAADQRPVAGALGGLPGVRRHDRLRLLAGSEVGAEPDSCHARHRRRSCNVSALPA